MSQSITGRVCCLLLYSSVRRFVRAPGTLVPCMGFSMYECMPVILNVRDRVVPAKISHHVLLGVSMRR